MKKLVFCILISLSTNLYASIESNLTDCAKISNALQRLACFDEVVKHISLPNQKQTVEETANSQTASTPLSAESAEVRDNQTKTNKDLVIVSKEATFGKTVGEIVEIDSIKTQITGKFGGWKKGAKLKLANGQTWKVLSQSSGYVKLTDPEVSISRGFWGSYNMKVQGLNAVAKVKRIN